MLRGALHRPLAPSRLLYANSLPLGVAGARRGTFYPCVQNIALTAIFSEVIHLLVAGSYSQRFEDVFHF